jgi:hypothetical protein
MLGQKRTCFDECASLADASGETMMALIKELFPICRSITGSGVRQTLAILQRGSVGNSGPGLDRAARMEHP